MKKLTSAFICLLLVVPCQARTIYVDVDVTGADNGSTWADAYNYLADALADANSTGDVNEIRVAQGIYTPDSNSADPNGSGDREATFQLINGVAIKGGFAGFGQPDPNARDIELYETILSGDLNGNDTLGLDPCDLPNDPNHGENSYHIVTGSETNSTAILDGFIITKGNANSSSYPYSCGSGMYNNPGSPTIINCTFTGNSAGLNGGGMYNYYFSNPTLTNCTFSSNSVKKNGGGIYNYKASPTLTNCAFNSNSASSSGGGMCNYDGNSIITNCIFSGNSTSRYDGGGMYNVNSNPTINNCTFIGNSASFRGGGIYNYHKASPTLTNCAFISNSASSSGGGMCNNLESSPTVTNCAFSSNSASNGGGMYNYYSSCNPILTNCTFSENSAIFGGGFLNESSNPTITNCTFGSNSAEQGGGIQSHGSLIVTNCTFIDNSATYNGGGMCINNGIPTLTNCTFSGNSAIYGGGIYNASRSRLVNCILWGNTTPQIDGTGFTTITFSDIQDGWTGPGIGNIDADPCFADPCNSDYHLKSEGWRWNAQRKVWTWDDVTSRCIDAGNPGSPLGDELLSVPADPNNIWGQNLRINMGAFGGTAEASMPPYDWALLSDINNDGISNLNDLDILSSLWLNNDEQLYADFDHDGNVDMIDFASLAQDWLKQTSWHE